MVLVTANLCDIIYKNNKSIKLFNASSSEIYKGHKNYKVNDLDMDSINNTNHLHPYSIAKVMGQQIVRFYREKYGLIFSNGILFTCQSNRKSNKFLLNKIAVNIKCWNNNKKDPLKLQSLESFRNIIHPVDVVSAINIILDQDRGDDYNICGYESHKIFDLVLKNVFNGKYRFV